MTKVYDVKIGDAVSAAHINRLARAGNQAQAPMGGKGVKVMSGNDTSPTIMASEATERSFPTIKAKALNTSLFQIPMFGALVIEGQIYDAAQPEIYREPVLQVREWNEGIDGDSPPIAVSRRAIDPGVIEEVVVGGVCMATVSGDFEYKYAEMGANFVFTLREDGGPVEVLWQDDTGSGDHLALVRFPTGGVSNFAIEIVGSLPEIPDEPKIVWWIGPSGDNQMWGTGPDETKWWPMLKFTRKTGLP